MRRTRLFQFLILAAVLVLLAVFSPRLLQTERVREEINKQLALRLDCQVECPLIEFHWLPFPHFSLSEARLSGPGFTATLPDTRISPDVVGLLAGRVAIGRVVCLRPRLLLNPAEMAPGGVQRKLALPGADIVLQDGALVVELDEKTGELLGRQHLELSPLEARIALGADGISGSLESGVVSLANLLSVEGGIDPTSGRASLRYTLSGLELPGDLPTALDRRLRLETAPLDWTGTLEAANQQEYTLRLTGDLPSLSVATGSTSLPVRLGKTALSLHRQEKSFELDIERLEVNEPAFTLHGRLARLPVAALSGDGETPAAGWLIDLEAAGVDLTGVRGAVLALWSEHKVARLVCDIVQGGSARSASFSFHGEPAAFGDINSMRVTAEVDGATIHVPYGDLKLTGARGPIEIAGGTLSGRDLAAEMGNSRGTNGTLRLDLTGEQRAFSLGLDLDADLAELPAVLHRVVPSEPFRRELSRFSEASGRARGHLFLGDRLHEITTQLEIKATERATVRYDRLGDPLTLSRGGLRVEPKRVSWQAIAGGSGKLRIDSSTGSVGWGEGKTVLHLESLAAQLDAGALLAELRRLGLGGPELEKTVTTASGNLTVHQARFEGGLGKDDGRSFRIAFSGQNLGWQTPLLPGPVHGAEGSATLSESGLELERLTGTVGDTGIGLSGTLQHAAFRSWQGTLFLNTTVEEQAGRWVKEKKWVPPAYFPRLPCTLRDFSVSWGSGETRVDGTVAAGRGGAGEPAVQFQLRNTPKIFELTESRFRAASSDLELDIRLAKNGGPFAIRWQGSLEAATLQALFETSSLQQGSLTGNWLLREEGSDKPMDFSGNLQGRAMIWQPVAENDFLSIPALSLAGRESSLAVDELTVQYGGEEMTARGSLDFDSAGPRVSLDLKAAALSRDNLDSLLATFSSLHFRQYLADLQGARKNIPENQQKTGLADSVRGTIRFSCGRFTTATAHTLAEKPARTLTFQELAGTVTLHPGRSSSITVDRALLCGLPMRGEIHSSDALGASTVFLKNDPAQPLRFEEVLPCLEVRQNVVSGSFSSDIKLQRASGRWSRGSVSVHSRAGRILRLKMLSQIFSVVNLTGILSAATVDDYEQEGFPFSQLLLEAEIDHDILTIKRALVRGEGIDLFILGSLDLASMTADMTVLIAPLKTLDAIVSKVPLLGGVLGGRRQTVITIPLGVKGPLAEPAITVLPPEAIGEGLLGMVKDTLMLPFTILGPLLPAEKKSDQ